ncbi:MAG: TetR/AcrR family transcriptional regulator C-terminal domain-containing protein [Clostridia bacterium]|nr:TetR/AcrR family transcriptional regulator C-terminal domain-containing protein [Clostridia bacterium]
MKYKEDLRIVRTRKHLSTTIIDMMQTQSLDKISVIDICKEAIVNRATFYAHFEDKYHLLSYALEELKDDMYSSLNHDFTTDNATDNMLEIAHATFNFVKGHKGKIANILTHNRNEKVIQTIKDSLSRTVKQRLQKHHTTYPSNVPLTITSVAYAGALVDLCLWYLDNSDKFTESDMHSHITALFTTKRD